MQLVPKLLRLTWFGFPLHYSRKGGWGFLVHQSTECLDENGEDLVSSLDDNELTKDTLSVAFPYELAFTF